MKYGWMISLLLPLAVWADNPRAAMREGLKAFDQERYVEAVEAFRAAAAAAPADGRLDPARAQFNLANALFEAGQFAEAAREYEAALRSSDLDVQQAAHFNRGNALLMEAMDMANAGALDQGAQRTRGAVGSYQNALLLNPADRGAKVNLEVAGQVLQQIEELLEQMPQPSESQEGEGEEENEGEDEPEPQPGDPESSPQPEAGDEDEQEPEADSEASPAADETEEATTAPPPDSMDEMSEEEAKLLLDAMRDEEQQTRDRMRLRLGEPEEVEKDW
jgi:tetratricopeptide (TPR) repeat protein